MSKSTNSTSFSMFSWLTKPIRHCRVSIALSELKFITHRRLIFMPDLSVEFATLGDLKVVERPTTQNLGSRDFLNVQSTIKVSSTDTGIKTLSIPKRPFTSNRVQESSLATSSTTHPLAPTRMLSYSMTYMPISWTTSSRRRAQRQRSGRCGRSSSGRIKSTSTRRMQAV
jgi:hypothetical protein